MEPPSPGSRRLAPVFRLEESGRAIQLSLRFDQQHGPRQQDFARTDSYPGAADGIGRSPSTQPSTGGFHLPGGPLFSQPPADLFMRDDRARFGIAQALFDQTGVVILQVEILIDSFVENIAAITMLRARQFVDLLQLRGGGPETDRFDLCGGHNTRDYIG